MLKHVCRIIKVVPLQLKMKLPRQPLNCNVKEIGFEVHFAKSLFADFSIKANDNQILHTSKCILGARSPVFLAMLTNDMEETRTNQVNITDYDSKVLEELLRYIYTGLIENAQEVAVDLIMAAKK